jgi:predicted PP-loop superfamily ATPase
MASRSDRVQRTNRLVKLQEALRDLEEGRRVILQNELENLQQREKQALGQLSGGHNSITSGGILLTDMLRSYVHRQSIIGTLLENQDEMVREHAARLELVQAQHTDAVRSMVSGKQETDRDEVSETSVLRASLPKA